MSSGVSRAVFVTRDSSVTILVQYLQGLTGSSDFEGVNRAVVIKVERMEEGVHRMPPSGALRSARSTPPTLGTSRPTPFIVQSIPFPLRTAAGSNPSTVGSTPLTLFALSTSGPTATAVLGLRPIGPTALRSRSSLTFSFSRSTRAVRSAWALRT